MSDKDVAAQEIVKRYALYAAGAGLIPIPVADFAAITALEVKMLHDLGDMYGVPFSQETVRPIVASTRLNCRHRASPPCASSTLVISCVVITRPQSTGSRRRRIVAEDAAA